MTGAVLGPIGDAAPYWALLLWGLDRQCLRHPFRPSTAGIRPGAGAAARAARQAQGCAKVHDRLRIIAGAFLWGQACRRLANHLSGGGQRRFDVEQPRHHPLDIAVHHRCLKVEGDGGDGGSRIGTDAG